VKTFKETKGINLVFVSGQNIDRLVTIYRACRRCNKMFLIDFYVANVLKTLNKKAKNQIPFPSRETFTDIMVYYPSSLTKRMKELGKEAETIYPFTSHKIGKDELDYLAGKLVMVVRPSVQRDLESYVHGFSEGCFIYSMWEGYKTRPGPVKDFLDFISGKNMPIKDIHTSGHADLTGLKKMVEAVKPKYLVPIHTFEADRYGELFEGTQVRMVNDKETVTV
jgi:ribonuclease J